MKKVKGCFFCVLVGIVMVVSGCMGKNGIKEQGSKERGEKVTIEATAAVSDTHPEIEAGITCADCHEVLLDGTSRATETWLYKDYLNFSTGEGLESNEETKQHIIGILGVYVTIKDVSWLKHHNRTLLTESVTSRNTNSYLPSQFLLFKLLLHRVNHILGPGCLASCTPTDGNYCTNTCTTRTEPSTHCVKITDAI